MGCSDVNKYIYVCIQRFSTECMMLMYKNAFPPSWNICKADWILNPALCTSTFTWLQAFSSPPLLAHRYVSLITATSCLAAELQDIEQRKDVIRATHHQQVYRCSMVGCSTVWSFEASTYIHKIYTKYIWTLSETQMDAGFWIEKSHW